MLAKSQIPLRYLVLVRSWFEPDSVMEFGFYRQNTGNVVTM